MLTAQPSLDAGQIARKQMRLAMSVGHLRQYVIGFIEGRHFVETTERAGLPTAIARGVLEEVGREAERAMESVGKQIPAGLLEKVHAGVCKGVASRLPKIR